MARSASKFVQVSKPTGDLNQTRNIGPSQAGNTDDSDQRRLSQTYKAMQPTSAAIFTAGDPSTYNSQERVNAPTNLAM